MSRTISITLPADIANILEIRAAIDDLTLMAGIELLLITAVVGWRARI